MKVAIATEGNLVSGHFGHCEGFIIYELDSKEILSKDRVENPGHKSGFLPVFLDEKGIDIIISGGMGGKAIDLFNEKGIDVITGATGNADDIIRKHMNGDLISDESVCNKHVHSDKCGNH